MNENILLKINKEGEKTDSGFLLAHTEGDRTEAVGIRATVVSKAKDAKTDLKEGDDVFIAKWEGQHVMYQGEHYLLVKPKDVLAIVPKK